MSLSAPSFFGSCPTPSLTELTKAHQADPCVGHRCRRGLAFPCGVCVCAQNCTRTHSGSYLPIRQARACGNSRQSRQSLFCLSGFSGRPRDALGANVAPWYDLAARLATRGDCGGQGRGPGGDANVSGGRSLRETNKNRLAACSWGHRVHKGPGRTRGPRGGQGCPSDVCSGQVNSPRRADWLVREWETASFRATTWMPAAYSRMSRPRLDGYVGSGSYNWPPATNKG